MGGCGCLCMGVHTPVQVPLEAKGFRSSKAGITGSCELPDVVAVNRTWVLCKSRRSSLSPYSASS